jgi:predicted homoserine dehydrogenase-like protein
MSTDKIRKGYSYITTIKPSIHIVGVVDIHPENAKSNMQMVGWDPYAFETSNLSDAFSCGKTFISDNWEALVCL